MQRIAYLLVYFSALAGALFAEITPDQRQRNLASFDHVWETVREKHWDASLGGLDWDAVRNELRPRVEKAETDGEVRGVLADMLSRLHLTHFGVIPGSVYHDVENASADPTRDQASDEGTCAIDIRVVNGEALVVGVEKDSSAYRSGVRAGWAIRGIESEEIASVLRRVESAYRDSTQLDMMLSRAVASRLDGPLGNPVNVQFRNARDKTVSISISRQPFRGVPAKFGYLPEEHMWIEAHRAAPDVESIAFNVFLDPLTLVPAFQQSVRDCAGCAGIVIDLRGNPGGLGILAMGLAGYFIDRPDQKLGTMYMRGLPLKFIVNPRPPVFRGALAILIDGLSASTSEIMAGGLQDLHRARIFGSRSAGAALPSLIERLPNGDGFQYAAASYRSESGKTLEGAGVLPDEPTPLTRDALLAGHDVALEAALRWIHSQNDNKGSSSR